MGFVVATFRSFDKHFQLFFFFHPYIDANWETDVLPRIPDFWDGCFTTKSFIFFFPKSNKPVLAPLLWMDLHRVSHQPVRLDGHHHSVPLYSLLSRRSGSSSMLG
uniref:Uncharacterized protein n=1 Tax=Compsopogon caeruleus TaxID=31354 RepID=A0A7S1TGZ0_9RHOD